MNNEMPAVIEKVGKGEKTFDLRARLIKERIIFLVGEVDEESATSVIAQMLYLDSLESDEDIKLYIDSPGGLCYQGFSIIDTMQLLQHDVSTVVLGLAASMASAIACAGTKGKRFLLPSSRVMIHEPSSGTYGSVTDLKISMQEAEWAKKHLLEIYNKHATNAESWTEENLNRDRWLGVKEAIELNLADKILTKEVKM